MTDSSDAVRYTQCCVVGAGPAGAMFAYLVARQGVDVVLLEKHSDFLRDFRGDTIHPSTLRILDELGLLERFLKLPHEEARTLEIGTPGGESARLTFERLRTRYPFLAFVPQSDFLEFLTGAAAGSPRFELVRNAEVTRLVRDDGMVRGVCYRSPDGREREIRAALTVGADGRSSVLREEAKLPIIHTSPPMDVLWFRLSRRPEDPEHTFARVGEKRIVVLLFRGDAWQVGAIIPKGGHDRVIEEGLDAFKKSFCEAVPELADRMDELTDWSSIKLLRVESNRLLRWYLPGMLFIGDAAHAMSPIGGVGINLAIQDAVVAANRLAQPLFHGRVDVADLEAVQRSREWPTRITQKLQAMIQRRVLVPALHGSGKLPIPRSLRALGRVPLIRDIPARLIAFGVWPVHVRPRFRKRSRRLESSGRRPHGAQ